MTTTNGDTDWLPIQDAPRDGQLIFVRDNYYNVDLAAWDTLTGTFKGRTNVCDTPTHYKPIYHQTNQSSTKPTDQPTKTEKDKK